MCIATQLPDRHDFSAIDLFAIRMQGYEDLICTNEMGRLGVQPTLVFECPAYYFMIRETGKIRRSFRASRRRTGEGKQC